MRRSPTSFFALILVAFLRSATVAAEPAPFEPPVRPRIEVHRTVVTPDLEIFARGMEQGHDPAPEMSRVENFTSRVPYDGLEPSERTVVYLSYDDLHVYAVWLCYDKEPQLLRAPLRRRDNIIDEDDSVAFQIDPFKDEQHLIGFQASANGAINDGSYTEGQGWDLSNDFEWENTGRTTTNGYVIVMKIPFRSLRFPQTETQEWAFLMFRGIGRKNEAVFFPWFSTRIGSRTLQTGTLTGIEVRPDGQRWQLTPYATANRAETRDAVLGGPWQGDSKVEAGLDGKLVWEDRLVWDFTVNPDFSQVESDQPQVLSNQRFEVFFPEKRPFFIENAGYFTTPINLLFTRRIVEPNVGVRLTGQTGSWAVSGLLIDDDSPPETLVDPDAGGATLWYGGLRRRLGGDSSIGGFAMYRRGPEDTTAIASLDGRQRLNNHWLVAYQLAGSDTSAEDPALNRSGRAAYGELIGSGQRWTYNFAVQDIDAGFHGPVGFVPRLGIREVAQSFSKRFETKLPWLVGIGPFVDMGLVWNEGGLRLDDTLRLRLDAELPRATWVYLYHDSIKERVMPADFPALTEPKDFSQQRLGVSWRSAFSSQVLFTGEWHRGDFVNFVPATGLEPELGEGLTGDVSLTYFPTHRLELAATYLLTAHDERDGSPVFETRISRLKSVYHVTHKWQLRLIVDHTETRADPSLTSLETGRALNYDALLQWIPSPGNAFYLGLTYREDGAATIPMLTGLDRPGELVDSGRAAFVKYSRRFDF